LTQAFKKHGMSLRNHKDEDVDVDIEALRDNAGYVQARKRPRARGIMAAIVDVN
jgi:dihydroxyacetone kinase